MVLRKGMSNSIIDIYIIAPQGHFRRAGRSYLVGSEPVRVTISLCWLETYFDLCATRGGSAVRRAFGNRVELANLLGQLLGERPAGGLPMRCLAITETWIWTLGSFRIDFCVRCALPVGPPCRARLDLVLVFL